MVGPHALAARTDSTASTVNEFAKQVCFLDTHEKQTSVEGVDYAQFIVVMK